MAQLGENPVVNKKIGAASVHAVRALHRLVFDEIGDRGNRRRLREFTGFDFELNSDAYKEKVKDVTEKFTAGDLALICDILNLKHDGRVEEVINRICILLCETSSVKANESDDDDDDDDDDDNDENDEENKDENDDQNRNVEDESRSGISNSKPSFSLSFRDIEGSVPPFTGKDDYPVEKWLSDFEETTQLFNLNALQTLLFAKKCLTGLAKLFIQGERGLTTWPKLKQALLDEFSSKISSADVHKALSKRKMSKYETVQEYFLIMKEMANKGNLDQNSVIQYVIDGIGDDVSNKTVLYGAKTLKQFKEKLAIYESIKKSENSTQQAQFKKYTKPESQKSDTKPTRDEKSRLGAERSDIRCYNCGKLGHRSNDCRDKAKGLKCFRCQQFGHKGIDCPKNQQTASTSNTRAPVLKIKETHNGFHKSISIQGKTFTALVDTGSAVNIISKDAFDNIPGNLQLLESPRTLQGFSGKIIKPLGCIDCEVKIDEQNFNTKLYIVAIRIEVDVIIGQELLSDVSLIIQNGEIQLMKPLDIMKINLGKNYEDEIYIDANCDKEIDRKTRELIDEYVPTKTKLAEVSMKIVTNHDDPIYARPRRLPFAEREIVDQQVKEWIQDGIVKPCISEYSSPVVLVKKKDGTPRLCIDYRRINKVIIKDRYPLPLIDDILDRLQDAKIFCTLDLKNGFFHVPVEEDSQKYTSFVTHSGQYCFTRVPFGLCTSPSVFQRYINEIFRTFINDGDVLPYMDDLIIPAKDESDAFELLRKVFDVAAQHGLEINFKKCQFMYRRVEFLGHVIEDGKIFPSVTKTTAVMKFPEPTTLKHVQSFLGLTGYFRKFIPNYSRIAKPLSDLLKKDQQFSFCQEQRVAFETLKQALCNEPVLMIYKQNVETEVHTDASIDGYGSVLLQKCQEDNCLHPVYYMSKKTSPAERKFSSYELEVLAVVEALKKFRVYLLGQKFKIVTDCNAFTKTVEKRDLITRVARWVMLLEDFDYTIEHRSGSAMRHVDALSRHPIMLIDACNEILTRMKTAQNSDDHLKSIREILKKRNYEDYFERNGILYRLNKGKELLVVPDDMQAEIINKAHQNGHFAVKKTEELIEREYFIPKLRSKVERCITNCVSCIMVNSKRGKKEGLLHPLKKEDTPLHTFHIDHMGPLATTNKSYNHILVVVDSFTKFVWLYPTKGTTTKEVIAKLDLQKKVFGNPYQIISDRGTAFTSAEFEEYCKDENIKHLRITAGLPRSNGQVERINEVIIPVLAKMSIEEPEKWYKHVDKVQRMINSTYQRGTGHTPMELLVGIKMRNKEDIRLREIINEELINNFNEEREQLRRNAKDQIKKMQEENKRSYNLRRKPARKYKVGDVVAIKRTQFGPGMKLKAKYLGPYKIIKVKQNNSYDVMKEGQHDGPFKTSTCAEYVKPWSNSVHDESEADSDQDGRM